MHYVVADGSVNGNISLLMDEMSLRELEICGKRLSMQVLMTEVLYSLIPVIHLPVLQINLTES